MTQHNTTDPIRQWIKLEHARLHRVEEWPESTHKESTIAAIHATLTKLERAIAVGVLCSVCASRDTKSKVVEFPCRPRGLTLVTMPAA